jgi:hypothetical protein
MLGAPVAGHPADTVEPVRRFVTSAVGDERLLGVPSLRGIARAVVPQASCDHRLLKGHIENSIWDEASRSVRARDA